MEDAYRVEPGLQRLMQGFAEGATPLRAAGWRCAVLTIISGDLTTFIKRCRTLDVGAQYQTLLKDTFRHNAALLINDKQAGFLLAVHVAYLKNIIDGDVKAALEHATIGTTDAKITAYPGLLSMLGTLVHDALFVQLRGDDDSDKGVVVYIPSDRGEPLRWYGSKQDCVTAWVEKLRQKEALGALIQLIGVQDRSAFFSTLQLRLQDAQPDLGLKAVRGAAIYSSVGPTHKSPASRKTRSSCWFPSRKPMPPPVVSVGSCGAPWVGMWLPWRAFSSQLLAR